ncbi:MAG: hypothetical protein HC779_01300 [Phyllobacteriaceae bacterium]|nr:hypothetical protein [Phyllobacteriaceae bacterium]
MAYDGYGLETALQELGRLGVSEVEPGSDCTIHLAEAPSSFDLEYGEDGTPVAFQGVADPRGAGLALGLE